MEYAKTKDILYVMKLLGHKNIKNTLIYTQLVNFERDEYVCHHKGVMIFRKRKQRDIGMGPNRFVVGPPGFEPGIASAPGWYPRPN